MSWFLVGFSKDFFFLTELFSSHGDSGPLSSKYFVCVCWPPTPMIMFIKLWHAQQALNQCHCCLHAGSCSTCKVHVPCSIHTLAALSKLPNVCGFISFKFA